MALPPMVKPDLQAGVGDRRVHDDPDADGKQDRAHRDFPVPGLENVSDWVLLI